MNDEERQQRLDAGDLPGPGDVEDIAYRRVYAELANVRPELSAGFAARVAARAHALRHRSTATSLFVPVLVASAATVVSVGMVRLLELIGYLEASPIGALSFIANIPPTLAYGALALALLVSLDTVLGSKERAV